ncbi:MAG: lytic transglycosylase domain-containing protein [Acidobacteriia bacterium]|nr:lytic transglycosylase domain-containing protein [Terriglobia bacterium]
MVLMAGFATAERTSGVFIFTAPDGTRRVVNVPASGLGTIVIPEGAAERRAALWPTVEETARLHGLDPRLVDLVIRMESGYNSRAVSSKGARGVMQLMPATASMYGVANVFDPLENIRAGVRYLKDLFARFNSDVSLALAAYNAGPEAVEKHGGVPPYDETRSYVRAILMAYRGDANLTTLSGGFGRPARRARPVELFGEDGRTLIANVRHPGEATVARPLGLR